MTISLVFCLVVAVVLLICIMILLKQFLQLKKHYEDLMESFRNLEQLNSTLRAQRHDYLNHLQVVYGMMELEEYEELQQYLEPVYKDMMKTGKALRTSKPAINALLKAKMDWNSVQLTSFDTASSCMNQMLISAMPISM